MTRASTIAARTAALAAMSALGACATLGQGESPSASTPASPAAAAARGSTNMAASAPAAAPQMSQRERRAMRSSIARADVLTQMTFWAAEYAASPEELETAQRFVAALRAGGRHQRAMEVATEALRGHPNDTTLLYDQGVSLIAIGRPQQALVPLALVAASDARNWRARSALGAALDQVGRGADARRAYQEALAIVPNEPTVMVNLGVSHLMAGQPREAETILRQASELPGAAAPARQNLALALGLQGRFEECERLQRIDLPPAIVAENMTLIRAMLSTGRSWNDLAGAAAAPANPAPR